MFLAHYGVGFVGKRAAPRVSLGWWFLAVQLVDLLWPIFLLLGWEKVRIHPGDTVLTPLEFAHYPITHSLVGGVGWGLLLALVYRALKGPGRDARWLAAGVGLFFTGLVVYLRTTRAPGVAGHVSLWSFAVVILLIYAQGLVGAQPPDERSLALFALVGWVIPIWGFWIDRTRAIIHRPPILH